MTVNFGHIYEDRHSNYIDAAMYLWTMEVLPMLNLVMQNEHPLKVTQTSDVSYTMHVI